MPKNDTILVLTTREYDWWLSLQEIIPAIDRVWCKIGESGRKNIRMLRVPLTQGIEQDRLASNTDVERIVLTAATPETVRTTLLLRRDLKVAAPLIIHIQGDTTDGFRAFGGLVGVLTERDTFVVSCEAEAVAARCSFPVTGQVL